MKAEKRHAGDDKALSSGRRYVVDTRRGHLVQMVRQHGFISIEAMAEHFDVSTQTIRRDVEQLSLENKVARYHGGAGLAH